MSQSGGVEAAAAAPDSADDHSPNESFSFCIQLQNLSFQFFFQSKQKNLPQSWNDSTSFLSSLIVSQGFFSPPFFHFVLKSSLPFPSLLPYFKSCFIYAIEITFEK